MKKLLMVVCVVALFGCAGNSQSITDSEIKLACAGHSGVNIYDGYDSICNDRNVVRDLIYRSEVNSGGGE